MKAVRIILAVLAGAIVLLIVVAVILVERFDPNDYKDAITAYVQERTGRTLSIDDDIELSLFPWFAVETGGLALSDDPAFGDRSFLSIDELSARVRVWPLLRRRVEIGRVILDGITLNLGRDAEGRGNWASLVAAAGPAPAAVPPSTAPQRLSLERLAVAGIELRNTRILWHDPSGDVRYLMRDLRLTTGPVHGNDPVDFSLGLTLLDVASQASVELALESTAALMPAPSLLDLLANIKVFDAARQERASAMLEIGSAAFDEGRLRTGPVELTGRLRGPPVGPDRLDVAATFDALELDTADGSLAIDGLETRAGTLEAHWILNGSSMLTAPRITGNVRLDNGRLAALFETLGFASPLRDSSNPGALAAEADFVLALAPLALSVDRFTLNTLGIQGNGTMSLGADGGASARIVLPAFRPGEALLGLLEPRLPAGVELGAIGQASLSAKLTRPPGGGRLDIDELAVALDNARLAGRVTLTGDGTTPTGIRGSLSASGFDNRLLSALFGPFAPANLLATDVGEFRLTTDFDYVPATRIAVFDRLELAAYGLEGTGQLTLADADDGLALSGQATLAEFSPRALLARFDLPVPQSADPAALGSAQLAASFETKGPRGSFRDIVVELDDSRITGEFSVDDFADPDYRFVLRADRIDADRYLPPPGAAPDEQPGERRLGEIRLAAEPLSATVASGTASVGSLTLGGMQFEQLTTKLSVGKGRLALSDVRTQLYGGGFSGGLSVDATVEQPTVHLTGAVDRVSIRPLLDAMLGGAHLSGTGDFDLDLTGRGATIGDALATAAGTMSVQLRDGAVDGFNLDRAFCAAFNAADGVAPPAAAPDRTPYTELSANATVSDGIASTPGLVAAAEHFEGTGSGTLRLQDQRVDYELRVTLKSPITIPGCDRINTQVGQSFPFTLNGVLPDVLPRPDIRQYIRDQARDSLRDEARQRIGDAIRDRLD